MVAVTACIIEYLQVNHKEDTLFEKEIKIDKEGNKRNKDKIGDNILIIESTPQ